MGQKYPIGLSAVYNAAEATKNENHSQIGIGWRWNFSEMITTETIDTENYLRYVNDSGAIHYMISKSDNLYVDEDGSFGHEPSDIPPANTAFDLASFDGSAI